MLESGAHTLIVQPLDYCLPEELCRSSERHRRLAAAAWHEFTLGAMTSDYSGDYAIGFQEGFADFLDAGPGNVPALPPRRYWKACYQTPHGHQAILDWYEGFREGALAAADSGYRKFATVPSPYLKAPEMEPPPVFPATEPDVGPPVEPDAESIPAPPAELMTPENPSQAAHASHLPQRKSAKHPNPKNVAIE
jgi:hypothetical protein